jgi:thiamine biosynthesis lipoprotein
MKRGTAVAAAVLISLACPEPGRAAVARDGQLVMGTILTVTVVADSKDVASRLAREAIDEARRWDDALTIWRKDGELSRLNERAGHGMVTLGPRLARGLVAMLELTRQTAGAFEPAVATLAPGGDARASFAGIREVLVLEGSAPLACELPGVAECGAAPLRASLSAGSALDPGAIGKGLALDAIASLVRAAGARSAFFDFGGSSQTAVGAPPGDAAGWTIVVSAVAEGRSHGTLRLRDASVSTSRAGATDTKPVLDPRSRMPAPGPRLATVMSPSATAADAWSTALVVLGREGLDGAGAFGIEAIFEDATGVTRSAGLPIR